MVDTINLDARVSAYLATDLDRADLKPYRADLMLATRWFDAAHIAAMEGDTLLAETYRDRGDAIFARLLEDDESTP